MQIMNRLDAATQNGSEQIYVPTTLDWRSTTALGTLMNTRGLMELIVLNIGLDLQVISPLLFAMMVIMALTTTMITAPVLRWLIPEATLEVEC